MNDFAAGSLLATLIFMWLSIMNLMLRVKELEKEKRNKDGAA
jgi:hypothetical protein